MTPRYTDTRSWAYLLVVGGLLLLAAQLGWLSWMTSWLWAALFLAGGAFLLLLFRREPAHWWALIAGAQLAGIGLTILAGDIGGAVFLGTFGAGFAAVYVTGRERWWAIIPAGVLLTLASVAWLDVRAPSWDGGWLFFAGIAVTFGLLAVLPEQQGRHRWAIYPAIGATLLTLVTLLSGAVSSVVLPLLLVATGAYLLWRRGGASSGPSLPSKGA
jgi:hypothetical protein